MSRLFLFAFVSLAVFSALAREGLAQQRNSPALVTTSTQSRMVMSWIPTYAIAKSQRRLGMTFKGVGPLTALTHLGLQFWTPTASGGLERVSTGGTISDETIQGIISQVHDHGIRVMLCVFNGGNTWDWSLAKNAFATNRDNFIAALITEMDAQNLDGIDVDFEGDDDGATDFSLDEPAYVDFISKLAAQVRAKGKQLTLDSFPYIWDAPNQNWWSDLLPLVDGMTSMGYQDIGRKAPDWRAYAAQKTAAGDYAGRLMIGMPSGRASWKGSTAAAQLNWVLNDGVVNVSIWDAQFPSMTWRTRPIWNRLQWIHDGQ
jgi:hypothetical protein